MGKTPTRGAFTRRYQITWEFLRRNEEYRNAYREFTSDPTGYQRQRVYFPPLHDGETVEAWHRRVAGHPYWTETKLSLFRRRWQIDRPHDPEDPEGWKAIKPFKESEVVRVIFPSDCSLGRAGPSPYLDLHLDVREPSERILPLVKEHIRAARADLDGHRSLGFKRSKASALDELEEALRIHDLVTKYGKRNWTDVARLWKPELRDVRLNRARPEKSQHDLAAARERVKYLWNLAQQHIEEGRRLV